MCSRMSPTGAATQHAQAQPARASHLLCPCPSAGPHPCHYSHTCSSAARSRDLWTQADGSAHADAGPAVQVPRGGRKLNRNHRERAGGLSGHRAVVLTAPAFTHTRAASALRRRCWPSKHPALRQALPPSTAEPVAEGKGREMHVGRGSDVFAAALLGTHSPTKKTAGQKDPGSQRRGSSTEPRGGTVTRLSHGRSRENIGFLPPSS